MAHIPKDAKWYVAEIIEELQEAGDRENLVHLNMVLIEANSPDEAFLKAMALGEESNMTYTNTYGNQVVVRFRGLRDLNVIHGGIEHGTEIIYSEFANVSESKIRQMVSGRDALGVFQVKSS